MVVIMYTVNEKFIQKVEALLEVVIVLLEVVIKI